MGYQQHLKSVRLRSSIIWVFKLQHQKVYGKLVNVLMVSHIKINLIKLLNNNVNKRMWTMYGYQKEHGDRVTYEERPLQTAETQCNNAHDNKLLTTPCNDEINGFCNCFGSQIDDCGVCGGEGCMTIND